MTPTTCTRLNAQLEPCGKPALFRDPNGCPMCEEHAAKWREWFPGSAYPIGTERPDPCGLALLRRVVTHHLSARVMRTIVRRDLLVVAEAAAAIAEGAVQVLAGVIALVLVLARAPFMIPFETLAGLWRACRNPDRTRAALRVIDGLPPSR